MGNTDDHISVGSNSIVRGELLTFRHGGRIAIGENCYIGADTRIWSGASITIGNHVMISHGVSIIDNLTHPIDFTARRQHFQQISQSGHPESIDLKDKPIEIGDDAWVAAHCIILRGVRIGTRSIVSAGSVVLEDVPPDTIVAGNPARFVRSLSPDQD